MKTSPENIQKLENVLAQMKEGYLEIVFSDLSQSELLEFQVLFNVLKTEYETAYNTSVRPIYDYDLPTLNKTEFDKLCNKLLFYAEELVKHAKKN